MIGDIHGNFRGMLPLLRSRYGWVDEILIVGDFGWFASGIPSREKEENWLREFGKTITSPPYISTIAGNHDNIEALRRDFPLGGISFIDNGVLEEETGTLFIGGAWSIDGVRGAWKNNRVIGVDWWETEEMTVQEWELLLEKVRQNRDKINTIVSHDCPEFLTPLIHPDKRLYSTRTSSYLEEVYHELKNYVKTWVFGHHHKSMRFVKGATEFALLSGHPGDYFLLPSPNGSLIESK